ncbi:DUF2062 domain-containing protein [Shewanella sp. NIFS-20-20]|uniref:DUF2062 domain-containing protein n=1 Tax=Shewanella sp. NIFS-20-20 TaxID=2853806 RepID=UPI001C478813|nr:DUF2062 domain-containing protein [Shewanella sp. NIFS-20-20]MBV7315516.1 DUF2062 domain-containing protein [Shewanella sp. NIFS-20-20]
MPKKFIAKWMPNPQTLKDHKHLKMFGDKLQKPNLWSLNRHSAPGAIAVGLFAAWIPIPFQMVLAAALAIMFHVNLPVAVAMVWVTNPITMPFMFYLAYLLGAQLLGQPAQHFAFEASWQWLSSSLNTFGPAFLLGCGVLACASALVGYLAITNLWKYSIMFKWQQRKRRLP